MSAEPTPELATAELATAELPTAELPTAESPAPAPTPGAPSSASKYLKLAAVLVLVGATAALFLSGAYKEIEPERVQQGLQSAGIWGGLIFILAFAVLQPMHVSSHVFIIAATLVWPTEQALLYAYVGSMACALTCYGFGAWVGEDWVSQRLPNRLKPHMEKVQKHSFKATLGAKMLFFTTPILQMAFGAFKVRFWPWLGATALVHALYVGVEVLAGGQLTAWMGLT